jgi:hypothetical protein
MIESKEPMFTLEVENSPTGRELCFVRIRDRASIYIALNDTGVNYSHTELRKKGITITVSPNSEVRWTENIEDFFVDYEDLFTDQYSPRPAICEEDFGIEERALKNNGVDPISDDGYRLIEGSWEKIDDG